MQNYLLNLEPKNISFLTGIFSKITDMHAANIELFKLSGINSFFETSNDFQLLIKLLKSPPNLVKDNLRREYGDFQTPTHLSDNICSFLHLNNINPDVLIEPTFGKGSFLLSALNSFKKLKYIFGIEIYDQYVWHTKFKLLEHFIENPANNKPSIFLFRSDIFKFDFSLILKHLFNSLLVLGNPPWITNSELSHLNSGNVPLKSNIKKLKGIDAITGKGNFDIGESIILKILEKFSHISGSMGMLLKNSVIKNLVYDLRQRNYKISDIRAYNIDAKKAFNASVEASLFLCDFKHNNSIPRCKVFDFTKTERPEKKFGWYKDKFISNIDTYAKYSKYDSISPFEWRQGIKHDCSKVFELIKKDNSFYNGFNEKADVEDELIYGLVKSSDLKVSIINKVRKYVIVTQKYIGQDTSSIAKKYPDLYNYLKLHETLLAARKSSIYKNKPPFSIFGIGEYSFKPFKIAVSGLYKKPFFALLIPENGKTLMVDDTCYILSFDKVSYALFTLAILLDSNAKNLLRSIAFLDAKRPYTKEILMRIGIDKIAHNFNFDLILEKIKQINTKLLNEVCIDDWNSFLLLLSKHKYKENQISLF